MLKRIIHTDLIILQVFSSVWKETSDKHLTFVLRQKHGNSFTDNSNVLYEDLLQDELRLNNSRKGVLLIKNFVTLNGNYFCVHLLQSRF